MQVETVFKMMGRNVGHVFLIVALLTTVDFASSVKIVMTHMFGGSHYMTTAAVADELAYRGHQVTMLSPEVKETKKVLFKTIHYDTGYHKDYMKSLAREMIQTAQVGITKEFDVILKLLDVILSICNNLVDNEKLLNAIQSADLMIIEYPVFCAHLIAKKYNKPWISLFPGTLTVISFSSFRIPVNPSYVPFFKSEDSDNMNFRQRLSNFFAYKIFGVMFPFTVNWRLKPFKTRMNISSNTDIIQMSGEAKMILGSCDFALDYPFPLMPNTFCVGPFLLKKANPLASDMLPYVSSPHGFILAAFGTVFNTFTREQVEIMATVFGSLKQNVIWQLQETHGIKIPSNVITLKWLPQNDLLGHENIRLFISHVGASSAQQAVYHGVPVLATPRAADQWGNGYRLQKYVRMAKVINIETVTEAEFNKCIQELLNDSKYLENAKKGSRRLKTKKQTPMQIAGDLIDYVIDNEYDVSHLQARALKLPFYVHELWDIYLFLTSMFLLVVLLIFYLARVIYKRIFLQKLKIQ